jgi:hypothetical protein
MIRNKNINSKLFAPVEGFEPSQTVLETGMLPLHYTDIFGCWSGGIRTCGI